MTTSVAVEAKVLGRTAPFVPSQLFVLPPEWEEAGRQVLLRDFITEVVLAEVDAFKERQEQNRLIRVLTEAQIAQGAQKGKVSMGGRDLDQELDPRQAVATALQAFEDRLYYVFIDDKQQLSLDTRVTLGPDTQVTFLRLVALAGG